MPFKWVGVFSYKVHGYRLLRIWLSTIKEEFYISAGGAVAICKGLQDALALILPISRFQSVRKAIRSVKTPKGNKRRKKIKRKNVLEEQTLSSQIGSPRVIDQAPKIETAAPWKALFVNGIREFKVNFRGDFNKRADVLVMCKNCARAVPCEILNRFKHAIANEVA